MVQSTQPANHRNNYHPVKNGFKTREKTPCRPSSDPINRLLPAVHGKSILVSDGNRVSTITLSVMINRFGGFNNTFMIIREIGKRTGFIDYGNV
jgi:hypothetical protein